MNATYKLEGAGCTYETKEDAFGDTYSGWWQDTVYLAVNAEDALALLEGN